LILKNNKTIKQ